MPLGFGSSRKAGRLEVEVAADTDEFDKAMDELPRKARKAGDEAGASFHEANATRLKVLKGWLAVNAAAVVSTLAYVFRDRLSPAITKTMGIMGGFTTLMNSKVRLALGKMTRVVGKLATSMFDWAEIGVKGAGRALRAFGERLKHEGVILNGFGHAMTSIGHAFEKFGKILGWIAGIWTKFKLGAVLGVGIFIAMTTRAASEFQSRFARVQTLLKGVAEDDLRLLGTAARRMSNQVGIASREINDTLYQTLSALPQLANDTAAAMEIVGVAAKVAATGFAEAEVAVRAVTGIMNAWKLEASEATAIADAMFAAQDQGVTTFGEMAASIGEVSGLTAALGGDWRDLLAIVATNTPFISTSETITGIASALSGVLEQGAPARAEATRLGLDFSAAALKAKGLIPFLREVAELTGGDPEIIAKLFGRREAVQLVVNLAQNMDTLNEKLEIVRNTTGTLEANLKIMNSTVERQSEIMKTRFAGLLASLGLDLDRWKVKGMEAINAILLGMDETAEAIQQVNIENEKLGKEGNEGFWEFLPRAIKDVILGLRKLKEEWIPLEEIERTILANPARKLTGFQIEIADAIEVGVKQVPATAFAQMIINAKGDIAKAMVEVLDEGVRIWGEQTRSVKKIVPPAAPSGALDYGYMIQQMIDADVEFDERNRRVLAAARERIEEVASSMRAAALFEFMETGDVEAYNKALDESRERLNRLILTERQRLIQANVSVTVANQLLDLYQMADHEAAKAAKERAKAATDALRQMMAARDLAREFGAVGMEDAPEALRPVIAAMNQVDAEIQTIAGHLKDVEPLTQEWLYAMDRLAELQRWKAELHEMGRAYGDLLPVIEKFGKEIVDSVRKLPVEEQREFFTLAMDTATILDTVTDAQIAYNRAVAEHGEQSDEAKEAYKVLQKAAEGARKILLVLITVFDGLGLATDELRAGLLTLTGVIDGLPGGGTTAERGGLLGFLFDNAETVEGFARGILSVADAIGGIGESARQSLQGVIDLASGIKTIKDSLAAGQGLSIGGIAQSIGGAIGIIAGVAGLFGESPEEKARKRAIEQNTIALKTLKNSLDRQRQIALGFSAAEFAQAQVLANIFRSFGDPDGVLEYMEAVRRFTEAAREAGYGSLQELQQALDDLGIPIKILDDAGKALTENFDEAAEALGLIGLEDIFAGVEGKMARLRIEMELFDIDEPLDQLKKYYAFLRDNTEIGIPTFDLDTVAGRAALDEWLKAFFAGFDDLDPEALGGMTSDQIWDLIGTIEGLTDTIDEGPDSTSFQEFRGITEVTANRLAGLLTTDVYWNEMTALNVRELVRLMGGVPIGPAGADDLTPNYNDEDFRPKKPRVGDDVLVNNVTVGTIEVNVTEAQDMNAVELADEVTSRVSRDLGNKLVRQVRSGGGMPVRTVR